MKRKPNLTPPAPAPADEPVPVLTAKLEKLLHERFCAVVQASKRSKTSIVEECLELGLPQLERQYAAMEKAA